jgi:hypothetical protein
MDELIHDDAIDSEWMEDEAEGVVKKKKSYIMGENVIVVELYAVWHST